VHTILDEYPEALNEGGEILTALSGRAHRESRLLAPFYDVWRYTRIRLALRTVTQWIFYGLEVARSCIGIEHRLLKRWPEGHRNLVSYTKDKAINN
jgi:hypothetical protein